MPSTYTLNNGIELIGDGEQSGTWGDTTNTNLNLIDTSLDGHVTITLSNAGTSGSPNNLPITDGTASNGRNRALIFTDGADLGADAYVQLTPNDAKKILFVRNSLNGSRNLILFQGTYNASNDFVLAAGKDAIVKFDGAGAGAVASAVLADFALDAATITTISNTTLNTTTVNATTVDTTNLEVTNLKAKDGSNAGSIADSTGVVTLASSVLTTTDINGGTIDGVTIGGASAGAGTFTDLTASGAISFAGATTSNGGTVTTIDINGGTIDNTVIGGASANAGTFTTLNASSGTITGDLTVDTTTLHVDSATNRVGVGTTTPVYTLESAGTIAVKNTGPNIKLVDTDGTSTHSIVEQTVNNDIWYHSTRSSADGFVGFNYLMGLGSSGANLHRWYIDGAEKARLNTNGLGINTSSPSTKLTTRAGSGDGIFVEDSSVSAAAPFVKVRGKRSDSNGSQSFSGKLLLDGHRTDAAVASGKRLGAVAFGGNHTDGSDANILYPASISGVAEGTFSNSTTMPTALAFHTGSTGRADTDANVTFGDEAMRITSAGNVGIGTTNPQALLDVSGDAEINLLTVGRGGGDINLNTALGIEALEANTTGSNNTAVGREALEANTTGGGNTALGYQALNANTTGVQNTALGREALNSNTTGNDNTAVGYLALNLNTEGINNIAVGRQALQSNTTGGANTALGREALSSNTTGGNNTAVGLGALSANTTGNANVAVGREALEANTTGGSNVAVGYQALTSNTTGLNHIAIGYQALESNTTGNSNTAVGLQALESNTTGNANVAVGPLALQFNTTGGDNTAVGILALQFNTTGVNHTAVGRQALLSNTTGSSNTALGFQALLSNTTGGANIALGREALKANTTGYSNTAVGFEALLSNTTGAANTAVGLEAGEIITTGVRNTILGLGCDPSAAGGNDQVVVGYSLTGKGNDTAFIGGTNGAYNEKNVTTWETTSDQRIKKHIADNNDGLNVISQVRVRNFEYRAPDEITELPSHAAVEQDGTQIGVIAQELQQVLPECVSENSTGVLSVNTDPLVWYLINAVKELKAEIEELKGN